LAAEQLGLDRDAAGRIEPYPKQMAGRMQSHRVDQKR
jgi:hypothetical protein